jgi:hypothetical protein
MWAGEWSRVPAMLRESGWRGSRGDARLVGGWLAAARVGRV